MTSAPMSASIIVLHGPNQTWQRSSTLMSSRIIIANTSKRIFLVDERSYNTFFRSPPRVNVFSFIRPHDTR
jgi:hypothetical protein